MIDIATKEFKIPKTLEPVVCYTTAGESFSGHIFLDVIGKCSPQQVHDFFEAETLFLPIRTAEHAVPVLFAKKILVLVEFISFRFPFSSDSSDLLTRKSKAVINVDGMDPVSCEVLIETPLERSRILDVLNHPGHFLPIIRNNTFSLIQKSHISRVVEP